MKKAFDPNDEKIIKMREVISRTEAEERELFKEYLTDLIKQNVNVNEFFYHSLTN